VHPEIVGAERVHHAQELLEADQTLLKAHGGDDYAGHHRGKDPAQPVEKKGQQGLEAAGRHGHARYQGHASDLGGRYGYLEIDGGQDRWRQEARADGSPPQRLEHHTHAHGNHGETKSAAGRQRGGPGLPEHYDQEDQVNGNQRDLLQAQQRQFRQRGPFIRCINQIFRAFPRL